MLEVPEALRVVLGEAAGFVDVVVVLPPMHPEATTAPRNMRISKTAVFFISLTWIICPSMVRKGVYKVVGYFLRQPFDLAMRKMSTRVIMPVILPSLFWTRTAGCSSRRYLTTSRSSSSLTIGKGSSMTSMTFRP